MSRGRTRLLAVGLALVASGRDADAGLTRLFGERRFVQLGLAPVGPALADAVALAYPVASASASVTYAYDPTLDTLVRRTGVGGPVIGERSETIGRRQLDFGLVYSWVRLATINGAALDSLLNQPLVHGRALVFPVRGGVTLRDGRFSNFLPVRARVDLGVEAHLVTPSVTYGITPDLDVNVSVPVVHTALDVAADTLAPDPRLPQFRRAGGRTTVRLLAASDAADGVGDLLLRTKWVAFRGSVADVALGLGLSLPTGSRDDLQGTGTTRVQPTLIVSHVFWDRVEPLVNVGVDVNADDAGRSVVRWAAGGTAQVMERLTAVLVFLGRHELAAQSDPIADPFFFQVARNDSYDASVGLRWRFAESGTVSVETLVPLERTGFRADVVPTVAVEYAFGAGQ
jgi:hypothetical protein